MKNQGAGKKVTKKHLKGKGPLKIDKSSAKIQKKNDKCHFCGKSGHFEKDCIKRRAWFKKKGEYNAYVCFESNLIEVPHNTWWINSGCTTHVSNVMQEFLTTRTINPNEKFVFMGNKEKVPMEAVGIYHLILDIEYHLDLMDTFYVPSITRNLISLSKLDVLGYSFKFENDCFSLFKRTFMIGSYTFYDGLYKLNLDNLYAETLMTLHHIVGNKCSLVDERDLLTYDISVWDIFLKKEYKD